MITGANVSAAAGIERHREPDEPVGAQLEHDRRQDHRARRRRLRVRIGQPGVEREHRDLDREGEEEGDEREQLQAVGEAARPRVRPQRLEVEGAGPRFAARRIRPDRVGVGRGQDRDQHQQRPDQRVQDELDRRVDPVGAAPDPDDQVHRDEDDLPEDVEQERVEREEDADHPDLEHEERDHVFLDPRLDRLEAGQDRDPRQRRGQDHQRDRQPVRAELVLDAEDRDPVDRLDELEARPDPAGSRPAGRARRPRSPARSRARRAAPRWPGRWRRRARR